MSDAPPRTAPLVGRPGDGWWLWAPLPLLALIAFALRDLAPHVGTGGLLVLNFMHLSATWTRLYGDARREHPFGAFLLPVLLVAFTAITIRSGHGQQLLLLVFLSNIPHIGLQNFGFIRTAQRARGLVVGRLDRVLDQYYQGLVPTWLAFWFATRPGADLFDSRQLHLDRIPAEGLLLTGGLVALLAAALWGRLLWLSLRGRAIAPERFWLHLGWGPGALLCFTVLPPELAALPLAGTHYVQYLVIVRRFHARGSDSAWGRLPVPAYLLGLALLAPGIPALVELSVGRLVADVSLIVGSAASLHHFLVDGRIWKLRESRVAQVMLGEG